MHIHRALPAGTVFGPLVVAVVLQLSDGVVAPAFIVFAAFTFPTCPLALCIPTPTNEAESEEEKGGASVGASRCSRNAVIAMCSAMLFLGVGAEIGYGTWIATFSLEKLRVSEVDAAYLSSSYYVGFLLGRLLAVPASTRLSPTALLYISFAGGTLALAPLLPGAAAALTPIVEPVTLAVGVSAALGLFIA
eukprot:COSAG04_NODE_7989_length_1038_cov_1.462194_1_plen_191_part_00